jgi:hypothetical protein
MLLDNMLLSVGNMLSADNMILSDIWSLITWLYMIICYQITSYDMLSVDSMALSENRLSDHMTLSDNILS